MLGGKDVEEIIGQKWRMISRNATVNRDIFLDTLTRLLGPSTPRRVVARVIVFQCLPFLRILQCANIGGAFARHCQLHAAVRVRMPRGAQQRLLQHNKQDALRRARAVRDNLRLG